MTLTPAFVAVGGAVGAAARYLVSARLSGRRGTLVVNTAGSGALGALLPLVAGPAPTTAATLVGVGFCGAFTTFSTVAVETHRLLAAGEHRTAVRFAGVVAAAALAAAALGAVVGAAVV